jgi:hypothetical protein
MVENTNEQGKEQMNDTVNDLELLAHVPVTDDEQGINQNKYEENSFAVKDS